MGACNVVVLAAGQGKRMRSSLPKVLQPLSGRPMLEHVLESARRLRPASLSVVYGHQGEQVRDAICGSEVQWALQEPQLGTGHALKQALPYLTEAPVTLVLLGDVPLVQTETLKKLIHLGELGPCLLTSIVADATGYGRIVRDTYGAIQGIVEHKDASEVQRAIREINTGIMALPTCRLAEWLNQLSCSNAQGEYYLTDAIAMAAAENRPISAVHPSFDFEAWGINDRKQLAAAERAWQRHQAENLMEQGVRLADPERLDVRGSLECGHDVFIDVGCVFEGQVHVADAVNIGPYCILRNVRIGPGSRIAPYSHLDSCEVGPDCVIGPYARLRPGSHLAAEVHVGNFVEIKNSVIGAASKANHLAYLGDADIGERVNIGAGTITCNYDGANKFRTTIEDDAFIGSDTQLVAPVRVGKGATLGAGTTLRKDAPPDQLTLSPVRQQSLSGWTRPAQKKE